MARESHTFHSLAKAFPQIQRRRLLSSCLSVPSNAKPRHRLAVKGSRPVWRVLQDKDFGLGTNARRTRRQAWSRGGAASAASKRGGGASGRAYQHMCSSIAMGWLPFPCTKSALQTNFAQKISKDPKAGPPKTLDDFFSGWEALLTSSAERQRSFAPFGCCGRDLLDLFGSGRWPQAQRAPKSRPSGCAGPFRC